MIGAHTGMNARGIALSEMGDSSAKEAPIKSTLHTSPSFFRSMLYDCRSLTQTLELFQSQPPTKRYHYVFGDGQTEMRAVKGRAHSPSPKSDGSAFGRTTIRTTKSRPKCYRALFTTMKDGEPFLGFSKTLGSSTAKSSLPLANRIPIKGGNVENVVYDATAFRLWYPMPKVQGGF